MKINGINLPENCSLSFHANGIVVRVSLNIGKDLLKYVPKGKSAKGDKFFVYWVSKDVQLIDCSPKNLTQTYVNILNTAMTNVRHMKQEQLEDQIKQLEFNKSMNTEEWQTRISFK